MTSSPYGSSWDSHDYTGSDGATYNSKLNNEGGNGSGSSAGGGGKESVGPQIVYGWAAQSFTVTCSGLKPSTNHRAYFKGIDVSGSCSNLTTDAGGRLTFTYNFQPTFGAFSTMRITTTGGATPIIVAVVTTGTHTFSISSPDGKSNASGIIQY